MSKKDKDRKRSDKEFRKLNSKSGGGYPAYIYVKNGDTYDFVGITHSDVTHGTKNIKLDKNPSPDDDRDSYIRPNTGSENRSSFGKRLTGWRFADSDKGKVQEVIDKNKKPKKE
jgi:hypothetical protein